MGNGIFNVAKGRIATYAAAPGPATLVVVLFKGTIVADTVMRDYTTLALAIAGNAEADFTNYARKTLAGSAANVDQANDWVDITGTNFTYTAAGNSGTTAGTGTGNNVIGKLLVCYNSTGSAADSAIVPMSFHDCVFSTDGTDQAITIPSPGYARAA
jgi:hypothetical protein